MLGRTTLVVLLASISSVLAQTACSQDSHCPQDTPCCSQYGACGVGAYCLGGCDPLSSFSLDACVPEPVCESKTYTFDNMDRIMSKTAYLGDSSKTDWVMDGQAVIYNDNVLLTMAPSTVGTVLASSTYMWYGNVKAKFKTSRGQGVVTAFILLSDVKDEIDYEFVGADLGTAQTNYYFQGITDYDNGGNTTVSDTFANYHTYEVDWTPDSITWLVDGNIARTKKRSDTWNATSNQWAFPQTPARVQLSIWPGGLSTNAPGTIAWAGGEINWNSIDIQTNGYYYATFESVEVSCYNASSAPGTNTGTSYTYDNAVGTNDTVVDGDKATVLSSLLATGLNMTIGASAADPSSSAESVPGLSNTGPGGQIPGSGSDTSSSGTATGAASTSTSTGGFSQNVGGTSGSSKTSKADGGLVVGGKERVLQGSLLAGVVALVGIVAL